MEENNSNKKKLIVLLIICALTLVVCGKYILNSTLFRDYPDAEYLTPDEYAFKPVYGELSGVEKAVYTALYHGITEKQENIPLPLEIDGKEYSKVYCILEKQESEFFYLDSVYYTASKVRDARIAYRDLEQVDAQQKALDKKVDEIIKGSHSSGDYYHARYISDYIINNCSYITGEGLDYASTAYGCLVQGRANCEGYAKAFSLLASKLGLESDVITGTTDKGENHAWNQVKIGTSWYNLDVTWADTDVRGEKREVYFLCSDEDFYKSHTPDRKYFAPFKCEKDEYNYYKNNGLYVSSLDQAEEIIKRELNAGKSSVELRFESEDLYNSFKDDYIVREKIFDVAFQTSYPFGEQVDLSMKENETERCITLIFK